MKIFTFCCSSSGYFFIHCHPGYSYVWWLKIFQSSSKFNDYCQVSVLSTYLICVCVCKISKSCENKLIEKKMNTFGIVRIVLMVFLIIVLVMMIILFSRSLIGIAKNDRGRDNVNGAISSSLVGANVIIGLLGAYREHFLFTLIFAILQTIIIIFELFITIPYGWIFIVPWVGSAILAYILAFMIKQGNTSG